MPRDNFLGSERRRYVRLDSVFPVEFRLTGLDGSSFLSDWLQGFTNNLSKGGLCLEVNNLNRDLAESLTSRQAKLTLKVEMPTSKNPVNAVARVSWIKEVPGAISKYFIGLNYEQINPSDNNVVMRYVRFKQVFVPAVLGIIIFLGLAFALNTLISVKLIQGNKALVEQLVKIVQESSIAKQKVKEIVREKDSLQLEIEKLQSRIQAVEDERAGLISRASVVEKIDREQNKKKMAELNAMIEKLAQDKFAMQEHLISLQHKESAIAAELLHMDKKKANLEKVSLDKMYQWLKIHQNPRTGLIMSFEGDSNITNWAFIYDQALVAQAYTAFSDFDRAKKIFNFFNKTAKRQDGEFFNAYYVDDGQPAEYIVHSGPNIWLGISILQYTRATKENTYLALAQDIAGAIIKLQNQDKSGGIRGGPDIPWYSTEHNLDAYAFFNMLYSLTGKEKYLLARDKVLTWLVANTYDKGDVPIKRGKGDSTIATDTYAWSIAAIGPEKLDALGMNPDRIIEFAEKNCAVEVTYQRPGGQTVKIRGFDFAPQRHLPRGGVVSSEWTAQMILAFKIMADFHYKKGLKAKGHSYEVKADEYTAELANMIISSPSPSGQGESCLPYATGDFVDTGHGWMTPEGKCTGSVAGTTYTLFAYYNYNPLAFKD